jgi:hypothetical protein
MTIKSNVVRTAGSYISCNAARCNIFALYMDGAAIGIHFGTNAGLSTGRDLEFRNIVAASVYAKSTAILIDGSPEAIVLDNITADVDDITKIPRSCIEMQSADATIIRPGNLLHCQSSILVDPTGNQQVLSTQVIGGFLDTPTNYGVEIIVPAGTAVTRFWMNGTWIGDSPFDGIHLAPPVGSGIAAGFQCLGCELVKNAAAGASIGQNWSDLSFIGGCASGNLYNFFAGPYVTDVIINSVAQSSCGVTPSTNGVVIGANNQKWTIANNDFSGVTTPITGAASLNVGSIIGNAGYNPVGNPKRRRRF